MFLLRNSIIYPIPNPVVSLWVISEISVRKPWLICEYLTRGLPLDKEISLSHKVSPSYPQDVG